MRLFFFPTLLRASQVAGIERLCGRVAREVQLQQTCPTMMSWDTIRKNSQHHPRNSIQSDAEHAATTVTQRVAEQLQ